MGRFFKKPYISGNTRLSAYCQQSVFLLKFNQRPNVKKKQSLKAVDFFCGGGGMTYGFRQAGIEVIAGIDIDLKCRATYKANNKPAKFVDADIKKLSVKTLSRRIKINQNDDDLVFIDCSPCQFWSTIKTNKTKSESSKNLLQDFQRFVDYFRPGFVVIENVPGIVTKPDSPLAGFIQFLKDSGYGSIEHRIIRVNDYGVPQGRRRFVMIASRSNILKFPDPVHNESLTVQNFIGDEKLFPRIEAGHIDSTVFCHTASGLTETSLERFKLTPHNGDSRDSWQNTELQIAVYKERDGDKNFGFRDVYGRMSWNKVAPTITTKFFGISHGRFGHPDQDRAISIREGARLQTFPNTYVFKIRAISDKARLIGNAVPPELAKRIAEAIIEAK